MKKNISKFLFLSIFYIFILKIEHVKALIPHYYFPSQRNLEAESTKLGKYAYQLIYFGQIKEGLNIAKLATKINNQDAKLWLILTEAQLANNLLNEALTSLTKAEKINPKISEIYFARSSIYLKKNELKKAKIALNSGLKIEPDNFRAIFQLGNIYLMEKDYLSAIEKFDDAIKIKSDFWQAINNKGLAYFEQDNLDLSIEFFKKAISIENNAESILALASCLSIKDIDLAISLTKKALMKDPNYVDYKYRKEQLWGEKLQNSTESLLKDPELKYEILLAKSKIDNPS